MASILRCHDYCRTNAADKIHGNRPLMPSPSRRIVINCASPLASPTASETRPATVRVAPSSPHPHGARSRSRTADRPPPSPAIPSRRPGSPGVLEPIPGRPIYVGIDFGPTPAAVFGQQTVSGQWRWIDELVTEDIGAASHGWLNRFLLGLNRVVPKPESWSRPIEYPKLGIL